jgi:hypothetical protein
VIAAHARAGAELAAAVSLLLLLQKCERATGKPMVTLEDRWRVQEARREWARWPR